MFYYDTTMILLIPAILFTFFAQARVKGSFNKYSKVANQRGLTGKEAARIMLDRNGLHDVQILPIAGSLTDNYNPKRKTLNLSQSVYDSRSVAAISVACHEAGHAVQHATGYLPLQLRNTIVPVVNIGSKLTWPLVIVGILLLSAGNYQMGDLLFNIGVIGFLAVIIFHLITLPVEFNASRRAIEGLKDYNLVYEGEVKGAKSVLSAAALTYVAALAVAVANLLRILAIRGRD